jgi:hypothetical protein
LFAALLFFIILRTSYQAGHPFGRDVASHVEGGSFEKKLSAVKQTSNYEGSPLAVKKRKKS